MIKDKPWIIGTNIYIYYNDFKNFIFLYNSKFIHVKGINNKYKIMDENNNTFYENSSESKIKQAIRVLTFIGLINPDEIIYKLQEIIKPTTIYHVVARESKITLISPNSWDNIIINKMNNDLRLFIDEEFNESQIPTQERFLYSIAILLASNNDKNNEAQLNLELDGTKIVSFSKYYKNLIGLLLINLDEKIKLDINKKFLHEITTLKKIMDNKSNVIVPYQHFSLEKNLKIYIDSEVLTFGKFVEKALGQNNKIKIPIYQREYRWDYENVINLLIDIKNINENAIHNIGSITLISTNSKNSLEYWKKIVDGQQRITSLSIILRAFYDLSIEKKWPIPKVIKSILELEADGENYYRKRFIKIRGNDDYNAFREMIIGQHLNPRYNKNKIFINFRKTLIWLSANINDINDSNNLWINLLNGVVFSWIIDKTSDEYRLFEKLNTGSINLNTMELFKNHFLNRFSDIVDENETHFQEAFTKKILNKFKNKKKNQIDDKKINVFILSILRFYGINTNKDTGFIQFKEFVDSHYIDDYMDIQTVDKFDEILNLITTDIDKFNEIIDPKKFTLKTSVLYPIADFLKILENRTIYIPLIMKILDIFGECLYQHVKNVRDINKLRQYFKAIEIFEIRFQVVSYRGQSLSDKLASITKMFDKNTTYQGLFALLTKNKKIGNSLSIQSEITFEDLLLSSGLQNKIALLICFRIENYLYFNGFDYEKDNQFIGFYEKATREHILPREYSKWLSDLGTWTKNTNTEIDIDIKRTINLIGNAMILPKWKNSSFGNLAFSDKLNMCTKNDIIPKLALFSGFEYKIGNNESIILEPINKTTLFTPKLIDERTEALARLAKIIWADI